MTAVAKLRSRKLSADQAEVDTLKTIAVLCGAGIVVSLFLAIYGLDVSIGFI
jgi:hypothetical protein